jgi:hypothetical protein
LSRFEFRTSAETAAFCEAIIGEMIRLFGIPEAEALGRLNRQWGALDLSSPQDLIFHEDEKYWAKDIYYGHSSLWWTDEPHAVPTPFP